MRLIIGFIIFIIILYALSRCGGDESSGGGIGEEPKTPPPEGRGAAE